MLEFPLTGPITVVARLGAGSLDLIAEERASATVDVQPYDDSDGSRERAGQTQVDLHGDTLTVAAPDRSARLLAARSGGVRIQIRVPMDSTARLKGASAGIACHGRLAQLDLETASGEVEVEHVGGPAIVRTASGDTRLGRIDGPLRFNSASGGLAAEHLGGPADAKLASGDVEIASAARGLRAKTASGDIRIGVAEEGEVRVGTTSGDVGVGVRAGTGVWLDLSTVSGSTRNDLPMAPGDQPADHRLSLAIRTVSGDIAVHRVA